jgi:hypothetical protein
VLLRLIAVLSYPAHWVNRLMAGLMTRFGLGRVPGALLLGLLFLGLTISTASSTYAATQARPEPQPVTISEVGEGRLVSGTWIVFDGVLVEGPHIGIIEVSLGGGVADEVERYHYLVADPDAPDRAMIVRYAEPIPALERADGPVTIEGTITEDRFNMGNLLEEWPIVEEHPDLTFSTSRLLAYAFETPFIEPSWVGTALLGTIAAVLVLGAFVPQPLLRSTGITATPAAAGTDVAEPIACTVDGELPTPRGPVWLRGTPARLEWMNVAEVARTQWRYWGAGLGDIRRDVEEAVRAHGHEREQLVIHGPTGSVIWPIEVADRLELSPADAYLGTRRRPALRVAGDGVAATLSFADASTRDSAIAQLRRANEG